MISGNNNRSPQYGTMGPKVERRPTSYPSHNHFQQQQQQQAHLLFMAGGSVRRFPQMSQGFSTMPNGCPLRPTVVQCNMQQNFANGYGYSANSAPIFQPHYQYQQPAAVPVHYQQPPMQYVHQSYVNTPAPPAVAHMATTSGFINGIKNMVKGLIQPLNCDFYSDHHKYYNPKYRKNYMRDIAGEKMSYTPHQPDAHVKSVVFDCVNIGEGKSMASPANVPKSNQTTVPPNSPKKTSACEVLAIFTSEDFPELPAPRRNRSTTPAKTEKTPERLTDLPAECAKLNQPSVPTPRSSCSQPPASMEPSPSCDARPKSMFFEIKCTTIPCGRRPTFGGRFKMVPAPFAFNKSHLTCRTNCQKSSKPHEDCDTGDADSFVIFQKERPDECIITSLAACRPQRQRQISECSDDSFVVFSTEDVDNIMPTSDESDDESDESDDESDDDDDDDGVSLDDDRSSEEDEDVDSDSDDDNDEWIDDGHDVVDFHQNKTDSTKCAGKTLDTPLDPAVYLAERGHCQFDSGFDEKKVTFNPVPTVHVMHTWNYAYRAARKGHWENYARDRGRFRVRIERASTILNPILTPEHRERIYQERFRDKSDEEQQQIEESATNLISDIRSAHNSTDQSDDSQILPKSAGVALY